MKPRKHFLIVAVCLFVYSDVLAQGDSYSNPITVTMDAVVRTYAASSSTGNNVVCTDVDGTPVTWFSFTTNSSAHCPLIYITASDGLPCEVAMYNSVSGNINNNLEVSSSMCFDDGTGIWAPAETFLVEDGRQYYLRIKTRTNCTISIAGQHRLPVNDDCIGAVTITTTPLQDNNACHLPGPAVTPDQLCAFTLENTAFYQFYVAQTGNSIINITDISCDNGGIDNSSGFQIGFFTGDCIELTPLSCTSGDGNFVQATSPPLAAGTRVYVAVDGNGGSNCRYNISGINVVGVLETGFKNFSVWEAPAANKLSWKTARHFNGHTIYIQKSNDGSHFTDFGQINPGNSDGTERFFNFEDPVPYGVTFYRLMVLSGNNRKEYSIVKEIRRTKQVPISLNFQNPVSNNFAGTIYLTKKGPVDITITAMNGQVAWKGIFFGQEGQNNFNTNLSSLHSGKYFISVSNGKDLVTRSFIRLP